MPQRIISFHYTLTDKEGKTIDSSNGRAALTFMEGSGQIISGLERQILSMKQGDRKKVEVPAAEAYGVREENKIIQVPLQKLPSKDVKIGDRFSGGPDAHAPVFVVTGVSDTEATLDGNHPLAGVDLNFDVEIKAMREATAEEISHGHAHGEHGHSH